MSALALLVVLSGPPAPAPPPWTGGRVYTSPSGQLHVGIRPHAYVGHDESDFALTVQLTASVL